jgi:hypothetical protein
MKGFRIEHKKNEHPIFGKTNPIRAKDGHRQDRARVVLKDGGGIEAKRTCTVWGEVMRTILLLFAGGAQTTRPAQFPCLKAPLPTRSPGAPSRHPRWSISKSWPTRSTAACRRNFGPCATKQRRENLHRQKIARPAQQSIAWQAHIGGFVAGLILFALFDPVPPHSEIETGDHT